MDTQNLCLNCFAERHPESSCERCGWRGKTAADVDGQLAPGAVLQNRYVVGLPLGRGGFSITYRGWDTRLQRQRAIKEYFPAGVVTREGSQSRISIVAGQSGLYSDGIQKYLAEARVLARFEGHPCIVFPTDFFEENATAYLVMEYLQGETLRQYVTRHGGRIPYEHAVYYLAPVLRALATVHEADMLHRDVSPDNVFLTVDNETKLLDFGAARQRVGGQSAAMTVIIRDRYAPPEQYSETGKQGTWTDIYAFGATFYYALTGESPPSALSRLMNDEIRRPSELGAILPIGAETMLMRALAIQPKERPQQIEEVLQGLLAPAPLIVAQPEPVPVPVEGPPVTAVEPSAMAVEAPPEPIVPVEAEEVPAPLEATVATPQREVTRPSRRIEPAAVAPPSLLETALATLRKEQWRWPVFALVAAVVALGTYGIFELLSPDAPVPAIVASPPTDAPPPVIEPPPVTVAPVPIASEDPGRPDPVDGADPVDPPNPPVSTAADPVAPRPPSPPETDVAGITPPGDGRPLQVQPVQPPKPPEPKPPPRPDPRPEEVQPAPPRPKIDEAMKSYEEGRKLLGAERRADRKRGYELVAFAANGGLAAAEALLGALYHDGVAEVQEPDDAKALQWYRKAAAHGDAEARYDLARRLETGLWEKQKDPPPCKRFDIFCKDRKKPEPPPPLDPEKDLMAWMRSQSPGKGTEAELKEALALYKQLAEKGSTDAQERVGFMLVAGNGMRPDRSGAFLLFHEAATRGDASAQYVVGKMYANGEGVARNDEAAVCWLRKAAAGKNSAARRALVSMGKAKPTGDLEPPPRECRFKTFDQ